MAIKYSEFDLSKHTDIYAYGSSLYLPKYFDLLSYSFKSNMYGK